MELRTRLLTSYSLHHENPHLLNIIKQTGLQMNTNDAGSRVNQSCDTLKQNKNPLNDPFN